MELRHIRYFVALAEELHFGRAAARLGISQPPLSQQIQALEYELKVKLFERSNRRVELTRAGAAYLPEAREILAHAARAIEIARRVDLGEMGEIRVGFMPSAPLIPEIMRGFLRFRQARPGVQLTLSEQPTAELIGALLDRRQDVSFIRSPGPPRLSPVLEAVHFLSEPLAVFLPTDHPLTRLERLGIADLRDEPFILFPSTWGANVFDQVLMLCHAAGFSPRIVQEARANHTILGFVAAGIGISVLPHCLRNIAIENLVCRRLDAPECASSIWLTYRKDEPNPVRQSFMAEMLQH